MHRIRAVHHHLDPWIVFPFGSLFNPRGLCCSGAYGGVRFRLSLTFLIHLNILGGALDDCANGLYASSQAFCRAEHGMQRLI
jgi:hypothetical protein